MIRRAMTVAAGALLVLPLGATAAAASPDCKPPSYQDCARPVWCDGTGYSCDAVGFAQWVLDGVAIG